jgi:beta-glucosidase/6-phospho-beta-glucosidase/beta-galactosidase
MRIIFIFNLQGAWNLDGKSQNIWDNLTHQRPELIIDRTNGDIAADSYHLFKEDVKALSFAGVMKYF